MKKAALILFAALLVVMFSVPAMAMEHQFGGYWRTRFFTQQNFDGTDIDRAGVATGDVTRVDTRTRLYYTAVFHENLKFVNKFEFDAVWGGQGSYGDIGADDVAVEVKNSYADFNIGPLFSKVGVQGWRLGRGFIADTDVAGLVVGYQEDGITIPFVWAKAYEGGQSSNALDADFFGLTPSFSFGNFSISPYLLYLYSDNGRNWLNGANDYYKDAPGDWITNAPLEPQLDETNIFYVGLDLDLNFDPVSVWFTGIYEGGSADLVATNTDIDIEAWLGAVGANFGFGMGDVHGQFFYATGDDWKGNSADAESFFVPGNPGEVQSYYWAEIMGLGIFDFRAATNTPGDKISNVMAANIGATIKPMDKLSISLDGWWAQLAEERLVGSVYNPVTDTYIGGEWEDDLGIEIDLVITYQLVQGLNLDIAGAYLFAGDAIYNGTDDADPYEVGSRLSLSF